MVAKVINILGVTGSIGRSAADVILANSERFDVQLVTANTNAKALAELAIRLKAKRAAIVSKDYYEELKALLSGHDIEPVAGHHALLESASMPADVTLAAIVGMAGLEPIMAAIENSKALAIANKEPLVAAGALVMEAARKANCTLLPVDSEHNAIFQVFDDERRKAIERIILTASGGPFLNWSKEQMAGATPEQAVAHPNWSMGSKISVDSASMVNKALEIIEAHHLFNVPGEKIDVLIHPQSVVHSMVEYCDGSVLAQMGASDMRTPIANVLSWPERLLTPGKKLDLTQLKALHFEAPDLDKFSALKLAYVCLEKGAYACVAFNTANEVAVGAFLEKRIGFSDIMRCVEYALECVEAANLPTINDVIRYDGDVRRVVEAYISNEITRKLVS